MRKIKFLAVSAIATAAILAASAPAWASGPSGTPGGSANVPVTGRVQLSCGFSTAPNEIDFGNVTPGEPASASTSYAVTCNDSNGFTVYVSDPGPSVSNNSVPITQDIYKLGGAGIFTAENTPAQVVSSGYSATPAPFSDAWTMTLPTAIAFPGTLSDQFVYETFGQ